MVIRKLNCDNKARIEQIAYIHEHIPYEYDTTYETNDLEIALRIESMQLLLKYRDTIFYINENNGEKIIGYIWFTTNVTSAGKVIYIKSTYVHPDFRRQGYATLLKSYVNEHARSKGVIRIESKVHPQNDMMRMVNQQLGYKDKSDKMYLEVLND